MKAQAATRNALLWVLALGVSLAGAGTAQSGPFDCPPSVDGGPKRVCPPQGPVGPASSPGPEHREKAKRDMEKNIREYQEYLTRPQPAPRTGIFSGEDMREQLGTGSSAYLIENGWYEIVNGQDWSVYAGSMRYDPDDEAIKYDPTTAHGFVIIVKGRLGKPNTRENQLYTPTAVGSLRITAAQGVVLTLESRQGNKFSLNVKTEKLTSAE